MYFFLVYTLRYDIIHINLKDVLASHNWSLIDGGANNGMACADMRKIDCNPHEFVDVIGATDGVDLVNLPVGTYCAKLQAFGGQNVIGVFNNHAGYGKVKFFSQNSNVLLGELVSLILHRDMEVNRKW
jgi:hypothetical protein